MRTKPKIKESPLALSIHPSIHPSIRPAAALSLLVLFLFLFSSSRASTIPQLVLANRDQIELAIVKGAGAGGKGRMCVEANKQIVRRDKGTRTRTKRNETRTEAISQQYLIFCLGLTCPVLPFLYNLSPRLPTCFRLLLLLLLLLARLFHTPTRPPQQPPQPWTP